MVLRTSSLVPVRVSRDVLFVFIVRCAFSARLLSSAASRLNEGPLRAHSSKKMHSGLHTWHVSNLKHEADYNSRV